MSYQEAYTEYKCGKFRDAIKKFLAYLEKFNQDPDAYFYLAISYMRIKDYKNALINFRKVTKIIPKDDQAWTCMVKIYKNMNDIKRAEQCGNFILPELPFEGFKISKMEEIKEIAIIEEVDGELKLPLVIADSSSLMKLYKLKKDSIIFLFRQASEFFNFITSGQKQNEFFEKSNYKRKEVFAVFDIIEINPTDLIRFEKELLIRYPHIRKYRESYKDLNAWYDDLSLAYIFLKQNSKKILLVSENLQLLKMFQDLKFTCISMTTDKFWVYLRYKLRRKYNKLFYFV
ncbi:MAG: hypothetical protein ACTSRG_20450 [Candidatus Helarchaeota archaeon]